MLLAMRRAASKSQPSMTAEPVSDLETSTALALHRSPSELRLIALRKEHERLLREIQKKRAACELAEGEARDVAHRVEQRIAPLRDGILSAWAELRGLFSQLLGATSHLNRRDKARVRRLYAQVMPDWIADAVEPPEPDAPPSGGHGPNGYHSERSHAQNDAGYSANKPSEDASLLRAIFRRLAIALHPDKVRDPVQREALTEVMKQVTRAYETGDVARLVELERDWLCPADARPEGEDTARQIREILAANKELRSQLRALSARLKELKSALPSSAQPRRGRRAAPSPATELDELVEQLERDLKHVRAFCEFTARFQRREIGITEFLSGPELDGADPEDELEWLLDEMMEIMLDERAPPRGAARAGRSRRGRRA